MIDHFVSTLPSRPYCGVTGAHFVNERDDALKFPLIQFNHPHYRHWIGIDVDQNFGALAWEDVGLQPNLMMINHKNGHAHYLYGLQDPIVVPQNRPPTQAVRYLAAVTRGLTKAIGGDFSYSGLLIKNPVHEFWRTITMRTKLYTLGEIAPHVELNVAIDRVAADSLGRNCTLFAALSRWAKQHRHLINSVIRFHNLVRQQADMFNATFAYPLPESEVRSVSKSVANYVWHKWRGTRPTAGIMNLDPSLPLEQRQSIAAKRTNTNRVNTTKARIATAIRMLGEDATWSAVAKLSGLSIRTVGTYFNEVMAEERAAQSPEVQPLPVAA